MPADDRDPKFERALAQHLPSGSTPAGCPDAEILAAYHERSLSLEEMTHWKQHIAGCATCQETLALVESTENQLVEEWQEGSIPVLETAATGLVMRSSNTQREGAPSAEMSKTAAVAIAKRKPPLLRWALPLGALAAGVLIWIGFYEQHASLRSYSTAVQAARNQASPAPEQKMSNELSKVQPPVDRELSQAQSALNATRKDAEMSTAEARRVAPPVGTKNELLAKNAGAAKKEPADQLAGAYEYKGTAPPPSANAPAQPKPPGAATQSVEVAPETPPVVAAPAPTGGLAGGAASTRGREADAKPAARPEKNKAELSEQAANNLDTSAMMMKQGVNDRAASSLTVLRSEPGIILTPDNKVWWRLGTAGTVEVTTDGGKKWKSVKTGANSDLTAGSAPSSRVCWIAGKAGVLVVTTDRGAHWKQIASPVAGDLGGVRAADEKRASIWDAGKTASFETADGGATWKQVANE